MLEFTWQGAIDQPSFWFIVQLDSEDVLKSVVDEMAHQEGVVVEHLFDLVLVLDAKFLLLVMAHFEGLLPVELLITQDQICMSSGKDFERV